MPLKLAFAPSPDHARAVRAAMDRLRASTIGGPAFTAPGARAAAMDLALPHAVYDLGRDAVLAGRGLEAAERTHVRYLVMSGDETVAAAELPADGTAAEAHVNTGPFAAATADAVRAAEAGLGASARDLEVRLLRVAALQLVALWLHDEACREDVLVPLAPAPSDLTAGREYRPADLFAVLRVRATEQARHRHHP